MKRVYLVWCNGDFYGEQIYDHPYRELVDIFSSEELAAQCIKSHVGDDAIDDFALSESDESDRMIIDKDGNEWTIGAWDIKDTFEKED